MCKSNFPLGYVINQYQYAKRYRYNNSEFISYFNNVIESKHKSDENYRFPQKYSTFGEFDLLEIIAVDSFRKYHDVSNVSKIWLGKRQSVLLYDISDEETPIRMYFDDVSKDWKEKETNKVLVGDFFCLSMLSLTNEIIEGTHNTQKILNIVRNKILHIVDVLNKSGVCKINCEVFGTFNTSEIGIVWLSNQYVDILRVMDSIKHLKMLDSTNKNCPIFFTSYSTIAFQKNSFTFPRFPSEVKGEALIQIAIHDVVDNYNSVNQIAEKIIGECTSCKVSYSVGEYDFLVKVPTSRAIELIKDEGYLSVGRRSHPSGEFLDEQKDIIRNNTRLLYTADDINNLDEKLKELENDKDFLIKWSQKFENFTHSFESKELFIEETDDTFSNENYYQEIRKNLINRFSHSAGVVDTLDLLYTDYKSVIASAYNALWVSDFHRQIKAVFHAINSMLVSNDIGWLWDNFQDLTNAFKQQIYHLSQSSRMFFETPSCHLRATGQYDYLMHAYYGITKQIIEVIYLMQEKSSQSELVPLITVNTVPHVKSQLYFESGLLDEMRVINLDIPNSIIFDPQRGICYLTHELFHYAVPKDREKRNYYMGIILISIIFKRQILIEIKNLLINGIDLPLDEELSEIINKIFEDSSVGLPQIVEKWFSDYDLEFLEFIKCNYDKYIKDYFAEVKTQLCSSYGKKVVDFCFSHESDKLFAASFKYFLNRFYEEIMKNDNGINASFAIQELSLVRDRFRYCMNNNKNLDTYISLIRNRRTTTFELQPAMVYSTKYPVVFEAIREACVDIAMISLNGMSVEDYMLFCTQCLVDNNANREKCIGSYDEDFCTRISLVLQYFFVKEKWKLSSDKNVCLCDEQVKFFRKSYAWFYLSKKSKVSRDSLRIELERLYKNADKWIGFFSECRMRFLRDYAFLYDGAFSHILSDFDISSRLNSKKDKGIIERISDIQSNFSQNVHDRYKSLIYELPDDLSYVTAESEANHAYMCTRFKQDLYTISLFQNQKSFKELFEVNSQMKDKCKNIDYEKFSCELKSKEDINALPSKPGWEIHINSLTEFLFYLKYCVSDLKTTAENLKMRNPEPIWFRGETDKRHILIPAIMRNFAKKSNRFCSLRSYQQHIFEEFKFRADGSPEMFTGVRFTKSDYIALAQHYTENTNFLDWSENLLTSLYFSLKYHFSKDEGKFRDVTLFLFHPGIYNDFRKNRLKSIGDKIFNNKVINQQMFKDFFNNNILYGNLIPNLSTKENEEIYKPFLLGETEYDKFYTEYKDSFINLVSEDQDVKDLFMPLAVWTSRLNSRIRTQSGCFVAFNLYAPPIMEKYDYISMQNIQSNNIDNIFMYKFVIDKSCCDDLVEWLKAMGVSSETVFPELEQLKGRFN